MFGHLLGGLNSVRGRLRRRQQVHAKHPRDLVDNVYYAPIAAYDVFNVRVFNQFAEQSENLNRVQYRPPDNETPVV